MQETDLPHTSQRLEKRMGFACRSVFRRPGAQGRTICRPSGTAVFHTPVGPSHPAETAAEIQTHAGTSMHEAGKALHLPPAPRKRVFRIRRTILLLRRNRAGPRTFRTDAEKRAGGPPDGS